MLGDVSLQPRAVDHVVRLNLGLAVRALDVADERAVRTGNHRTDLTLHRVVPALLTPFLHLPLPTAPPRRVGAAHVLVELGPVGAFELAHLGLELAAPYRLRVVEALVREAVAALAPHEDARPVRAGHERPEQVDDLGLEPVLRAIVHEPLEHPGRDDAAAAQQHRAGPGAEELVDVLVRLVGVDDVREVLVLGAEFLQVREELQAGVANGHVHEPGAVSDPLGTGGAVGWREDREVTAAGALAHHPDEALGEHVPVPDPLRLPLQVLEDHACARRIEIGPERFDQHLPRRPEALRPEHLLDRVRGEAPDVVRPGRGVRPDALRPRDLGNPGQVLVRLPGVMEVGEDLDLRRRDSGDAQVVHGDERADAAADRDERDIDDRDASLSDLLIGPEVAAQQFRREVAAGRRLTRNYRCHVPTSLRSAARAPPARRRSPVLDVCRLVAVRNLRHPFPRPSVSGRPPADRSWRRSGLRPSPAAPCRAAAAHRPAPWPDAARSPCSSRSCTRRPGRAAGAA